MIPILLYENTISIHCPGTEPYDLKGNKNQLKFKN